MSTITLPPPLPGNALRFTISAAFSSLALCLLPFFLVGLLGQCIFYPLSYAYESWTAKPKKRRAAKNAAKNVPTVAVTAAAQQQQQVREGSPTSISSVSSNSTGRATLARQYAAANSPTARR
ncbi:uncharacterized protein EHS24_001487 [Apiotrichum porosum]|uniref:Uncharacterized protein n=1 Tax=Apiotrichum porosum TaxID=105984 RepID=A0A427XKS9_9TREE|nr:uncharacterized protein EHS24_001487 [Apiotrichum porosum]RSH79438.1 hypothetical protein EHS24_001487 [Apiotrichum porosum]